MACALHRAMGINTDISKYCKPYLVKRPRFQSQTGIENLGDFVWAGTYSPRIILELNGSSPLKRHF